MLRKTGHIIRVSEFRPGSEEKSLFPSFSSRMQVLQYYSMVFQGIKIWERLLETGYFKWFGIM